MKVCLLGKNGFIGSNLLKEMEKRGWKVVTTPEKDCKAIFHFASYTHIPFEKNVAYHTQEILNSFMYLLAFCQEHDITFIYPSSALVYESPRPFYHLKKTLEELVKIYNVKSIGLRIFPVYGAGEGNRGHKTAIYQWIEQMVRGQRPIVYGNGTQARDFVYISDVIDAILDLFTSKKYGVFDIGYGKPVVFNDIIKIINLELLSNLQPVYKKTPSDYAKGIKCQHPIRQNINIREGIREIISEVMRE